MSTVRLHGEEQVIIDLLENVRDAGDSTTIISHQPGDWIIEIEAENLLELEIAADAYGIEAERL